MKREIASTIVVIKGLAITVGSKPIRLASIGSVHPTTFATITVATKVEHTTAATSILTLSNNISFTKLAAQSVTPHRTETRASFQMTLGRSPKVISPRDRPLMIVTDD